MIEKILAFAVERRVLVVLLTAFAAIYGATQLVQLPVDAVPDITNRQVQINAVAPSLGPTEMERQVSYPIETAMAGMPGIGQAAGEKGADEGGWKTGDDRDQRIAKHMAKQHHRVGQAFSPCRAHIVLIHLI